MPEQAGRSYYWCAYLLHQRSEPGVFNNPTAEPVALMTFATELPALREAVSRSMKVIKVKHGWDLLDQIEEAEREARPPTED